MKKKFRFHRVMLEDSMKTVVEFKDKTELLEIINRDLAQWSIDPVEPEELLVEHYCNDKRIKWDTYIVTAPQRRLGVLGFTNCPVE